MISLNLQAQNQTGIITYKGVINEKFVDSFLTAYEQKERPMALKQRVVNAMRNAKPEEFILNFKNTESYYYNKPDLEQDGSNMGSRAGLTPYYTNTATDTIIEMTRSLGNIALKPIEWEITNKTKKMGIIPAARLKLQKNIIAGRDTSITRKSLPGLHQKSPLVLDLNIIKDFQV